MLGLLAILFMVGYIALLAVVSGFVLSTLWGWFVVPVFKLPALGIAQAIGLGMLVTWFTAKMDLKDDDRSPKEKFNSLLAPWVKAILVLLIAWVVKQFV